MRVRKDSEKAGLKSNTKKSNIIASSSITSCQKEGETVETVTDFFLACKITAASNCSHENKRCLVLVKKAMTKLDNVLNKQRYLLASKSIK